MNNFKASAATARAMGSHHSAVAGTVEWLTPPYLVDSLGPFDLDPCAPVVRPWPTAAEHFTVDDDGLSKLWFGRVWLNPPYGLEAAAWLARIAAHGTGTALIFARTETKMFFDYVWNAASALLFLEGRLNFHHADGRRAEQNAGAPSVLIAYGDVDADRLGGSGLAGKFLPVPNGHQVVAIIPITWLALVAAIADRHGGVVTIQDTYRALARHPKVKSNPHWREKVRQTLQSGRFERVGRGVYRLQTSAA